MNNLISNPALHQALLILTLSMASLAVLLGLTLIIMLTNRRKHITNNRTTISTTSMTHTASDNVGIGSGISSVVEPLIQWSPQIGGLYAQNTNLPQEKMDDPPIKTSSDAIRKVVMGQPQEKEEQKLKSRYDLLKE